MKTQTLDHARQIARQINRVAWQMLRAGRITVAQYHARIEKANHESADSCPCSPSLESNMKQVKHEGEMSVHLESNTKNPKLYRVVVEIEAEEDPGAFVLRRLAAAALTSERARLRSPL